MDLKQSTDDQYKKRVTIFVVYLLLLGLSQASSTWATTEDDDADFSIKRPLPLRPFGGPNTTKNKYRSNSTDEPKRRDKYKWDKSKGHTAPSIKANERFGKTEGKVEFRLVHDTLIKKTLQKKNKTGKNFSKAPLLPNLDTNKRSYKP